MFQCVKRLVVNFIALVMLAGAGLSGWLAFQQAQGYILVLYLLLGLALLAARRPRSRSGTRAPRPRATMPA